MADLSIDSFLIMERRGTEFKAQAQKIRPALRLFDRASKINHLRMIN